MRTAKMEIRLQIGFLVEYLILLCKYIAYVIAFETPFNRNCYYSVHACCSLGDRRSCSNMTSVGIKMRDGSFQQCIVLSTPKVRLFICACQM